jgi:hypothetical protein
VTLLNTYLETLDDCGVGDFSFDECLRDYRLGLVNNFVVMVLGVAVLDVMAQRDGWAVEVLRRVEATVRDHDLVEFLRDGAFGHA